MARRGLDNSRRRVHRLAVRLRRSLSVLAGGALAVTCFHSGVASSLEAAGPIRASADAGTAPTTGRACSYTVRGPVQIGGDCVVKQEYEDSRDADAGPTFVAIHEWPWAGASPTRPTTRIVFHVLGRPTPGIQLTGAVAGAARVERGTDRWEATSYPHAGSMGAFAVTLDTVRAVRVGGKESYEVHGHIDADLLPTVEGTASGVVRLVASF